jgi:hypothetical protein
VPGAPVRVGAWAFDADTGKAYKLSGTHVINQLDTKSDR